MKRKRKAFSFPSEASIVRAASSLLIEGDGAPTAFRIWKAGDNPTDLGVHRFTERSAALLIEQQERRGNLFSIDYDHLSLDRDRPATAGQAAGWHSLEVRDSDEGPELWAVAVEWCAPAKAGLEEDPPRWRYFSPAYEVDKDGEIFSYVNLALCINPRTWNVTQLATRRAQQPRMNIMKKAALLAALKAAAEAGDEDAKSAFAAYGGDEALAAARAAEGDDDGEKKSDDEPAKGDDEDAPKAAKKAAEGDDEKKDPPYEAAARRAAKYASPIKLAAAGEAELAIRVAELEAEKADRERQAFIAAHADRFTASLRDWAKDQPLSVLASFVKRAPKVDLSAPGVETPARGQLAGSPEGSAHRAAVEAAVDRALGIRTAPAYVGFGPVQAGVRTLNTHVTPIQARAAKKGA